MTLLDVLADPSRREILGELLLGQKKVGEIVQATGLKQPNVSNHLAKMRSAGIVRSTKIGREVFYAISDPELVQTTTNFVLGQNDDKFLALDSATALGFAKRAVAGDLDGCEETVTLLLRQGESLADIYSKLFDSTMQYIGDWWQVNAIDEAKEHLATSIVEQCMARVSQFYGSTHKNSFKAVLGCSEGNMHFLGLKMLCDIMRSRGWENMFLGANVPNEPFIGAVKEHTPHAVLVSCCVESNVERCNDLIRRLNGLRDDGLNFKLCAGGSALLRQVDFESIGVDYSASNLTEFFEQTLPRLEKSLATNN